MSENHEESHFMYHDACNDCGSSDALAVYSDGGTTCFSCGKTRKQDGPIVRKESKQMTKEFLTGEFRSLPSRKLTEDTCRKFGYFCTTSGEPLQVANYRKDGDIVAQKVRGKDKQFRTVGNPNHAGSPRSRFTRPRATSRQCFWSRSPSARSICPASAVGP